MCAKLLILESPGKVKKVQEILGSDQKVTTSIGHVRDPPVKEMGVAAPQLQATTYRKLVKKVFTIQQRYMRRCYFIFKQRYSPTLQ